MGEKGGVLLLLSSLTLVNYIFSFAHCPRHKGGDIFHLLNSD